MGCAQACVGGWTRFGPFKSGLTRRTDCEHITTTNDVCCCGCPVFRVVKRGVLRLSCCDAQESQTPLRYWPSKTSPFSHNPTRRISPLGGQRSRASQQEPKSPGFKKRNLGHPPRCTRSNPGPPANAAYTTGPNTLSSVPNFNAAAISGSA